MSNIEHRLMPSSLSLPMSVNETTYRKAVNQVRSQIKEWASFLIRLWFVSYILHLQCVTQERTYLFIQCSPRSTAGCPCLAWQRRRTKVDEVSWLPKKDNFWLWFRVTYSDDHLDTCLVESMGSRSLLEHCPYHWSYAIDPDTPITASRMQGHRSNKCVLLNT